jgi:transporter family-2 protein
MTTLYIALMVAAGAAVAAQVAINAHLRTVAGSGLWATNISFAVTMAAGLAALAAGLLAGRAPVPPAAALAGAPAWIWLGGLGGFAYVFLALLSAHRISGTVVATAGIVGQLCASVIIDHYGWFGMPAARVSATRLLGLGLLAAGLVLIRWR